MCEAFEQINQNKGCAQAPVRAPSFSCTQIVLTGYPSEDTLILILIRNLHEACSDRWSGPMCQYTCDGCCDIEMLVSREGVLVAPPRSPLTQWDQLRRGRDWIMVRMEGGCQHPGPASTAASVLPSHQDINIPGLVLVSVVRLTPGHPSPMTTLHPPSFPGGAVSRTERMFISGITPSRRHSTVTAVTIIRVWRTGCGLTEISASTEGPASAQQPRLCLLEAANTLWLLHSSLSLSPSQGCGNH